MRCQINSNNITERIFILSELLKQGYKWHGEDNWTALSIVGRYPRFPIIQINTVHKYLSGSLDTSDRPERPLVTLYDVIGFKRIPSQDKGR